MCLTSVMASLCAGTMVAQKGQVSVETLIRQGKLAEAQTRIEQLLHRNPEDVRAFYLLGELRTKQAKWFDAEKAYRQSLELNGRPAEALESLGRLYADEGKNAEAIALYEQARGIAPKQAITTQLATLYMRDGQFEQSLQMILKMPAASRPEKLLPVMVADYIGLKRNEDVQKTVPEILHRAPQHPELVPQLGNVFLQAGMVGDAAELVKLAQQHLKPSAALLTVLANVQARTGKTDEASATLSRALAMDPNNTDALWGAARLAGSAGQWKQAVAYIKRMEKLTAPQNQVLQNLVYASLQINDLQTAHDAALDLRDLEPNSLDSVLVMSAVLIQGLQWGEAEALAKEALKRFPDNKRLHYSAGMAEFNMGKLDDAERNLRASLGQGTADAETYYSLAMMAKQRGDIPGAVELLKQSLAIDAKHHKALLSLGQLYLQTNEIEPARAVLERAITEAPDDPQNHYQLAMAYRRLGMGDKAKAQMEEFQKLTLRHVPQFPPGETVPSPR